MMDPVTLGMANAAAKKLVLGQQIKLQAAPSRLSIFKTAVTNRATAPVNVWVLGDSITEGQGANALTERWQNILSARLKADYPTTGATGVATPLIPSFYVASGFTQPTTAGSPVQVTNMGPGGRSYSMNATTQYVQWANVQGTSFSLLYAKLSSGGNIIVSIDGVDQAPITASSGQAYAVDGFRTEFPLTAGTHTVKVRPADTSGIQVGGILIHNGDEAKGIKCLDMGHWGWVTGHFTGTMGNSLQSQAVTLPPSLVVISLMANDWNANNDPAGCITNLQTIISKIRTGAVVDPAFLIVMYPPRGYAAGRTYTWDQYVAAAKTVAANDPQCAVLDLRGLMPGRDDDATLYTDAVHPNTAGHAMIANLVTTYIEANIA